MRLSANTGDVASMDAFFELQTILRPQDSKVGQVVSRKQQEYMKRVSEPAEATNETDTHVDGEWTHPVGQGIAT